eukprot:TRINITY_DN2389_c0_g1_i1.p1 TRINITY_DN2389_c0_g1~~TRINITY_DN2389_c0_g1_i1.p1  ORF type:complete len:904 (-),score=188.66 TRINITY_DN2389_c0_g1_i1:30-2741(-)
MVPGLKTFASTSGNGKAATEDPLAPRSKAKPKAKQATPREETAAATQAAPGVATARATPAPLKSKASDAALEATPAISGAAAASNPARSVAGTPAPKLAGASAPRIAIAKVGGTAAPKVVGTPAPKASIAKVGGAAAPKVTGTPAPKAAIAKVGGTAAPKVGSTPAPKAAIAKVGGNAAPKAAGTPAPKAAIAKVAGTAVPKVAGTPAPKAAIAKVGGKAPIVKRGGTAAPKVAGTPAPKVAGTAASPMEGTPAVRVAAPSLAMPDPEDADGSDAQACTQDPYAEVEPAISDPYGADMEDVAEDMGAEPDTSSEVTKTEAAIEAPSWDVLAEAFGGEVIDLDDDEDEALGGEGAQHEAEASAASSAVPSTSSTSAPEPSPEQLREQLREEVLQQLLKEPGHRASLGRLVTQRGIAKVMRLLSESEQLPMSGMPSMLGDLLRASSADFVIAEPQAVQGKVTREQDMRISLSGSGLAAAEAVSQKVSGDAESDALNSQQEEARKRTKASPSKRRSQVARTVSLGAGSKAAPSQPPQTLAGVTDGLADGSSNTPTWTSSKRRKTAGQSPPEENLAPGQQTPVRKPQEAPGEVASPGGSPSSKGADWQKNKTVMMRIPAPKKKAGPDVESQEAEADTSAGWKTPTTGVGAKNPAGSATPLAVGAQLPAKPTRPAPQAAPKANPPFTAAPKAAPKASGAFGPPKRPIPATCAEAVDNEGRPFDLSHVVVNFANVGATYGERVLRRNKATSYLFDYEGVRRCVRHLKENRGLSVIGVIFENFRGAENGREVMYVPPDIQAMCESIELTPRLTGQHHRSADDEMTIKCAYRRNCRFLDNDNYQDWLSNMFDQNVRAWLLHCQEFLQMRFYFDSGLGAFDVLDGNIPAHWLAQGPAVAGTMKRLNSKNKWH